MSEKKYDEWLSMAIEELAFDLRMRLFQYVTLGVEIVVVDPIFISDELEKGTLRKFRGHFHYVDYGKYKCGDRQCFYPMPAPGKPLKFPKKILTT